MFSTFGKLFCATALASVVLARDVFVSLPASGSVVTAGSEITVQIASQPPSDSDETSLSLAISFIAGNSDPSQYLGRIASVGTYNPQSTNSAGDQYQNFSLTAPDWFEGLGQINVASFYAEGPYASPNLQFTSSAIHIVGTHG